MFEFFLHLDSYDAFTSLALDQDVSILAVLLGTASRQNQCFLGIASAAPANGTRIFGHISSLLFRYFFLFLFTGARIL